MSAVDFDLTLDPDDPNAHPPSDSKNPSLPIDTDSYHPFFYRRPRPNVGTAPIYPPNDPRSSFFSDTESALPPGPAEQTLTTPHRNSSRPRPRKRQRQLRLTSFLNFAAEQDGDPTASVDAIPNMEDISQKGINNSPFHRYKAIPTPRVITLNVNTLGVNVNSDRARFNKVYRLLKYIAKGADVLLLQETNTDLDVLDGVIRIPGFTSYANPGCTAIFIRDAVTVGCSVEPFVITEGYTHGVRVTPTDGTAYFTSSWTVLNIYLQSGSCDVKRAVRLSQIHELKNFTITTEFGLAGGDWNMVFSPDDTATGNHYASRGDDVLLLESTLQALGLCEIYQPDFTRYKNTDPPQAARLDRVYATHGVAIQTIMRAEAVVLPIPIRFEVASFTDHRPVKSFFTPNQVAPGSRWKMPEWVVSCPNFISAVLEEWDSRVRDGNWV